MLSKNFELGIVELKVMDPTPKGTVMGKLRIDSSWITMYAFLVHAIERELAKASRLTLTQYRIMLALSQAQDHCRAGELSKSIGLKPSTITEAVDQLVVWGFVVRDYDDAEDRRTVRIGLTPEGLSCIEDADKALIALIADIWGPDYGTATRKTIFQQAAESVLASGQARIEKRGIRADTAYLISVLIGYTSAERNAREEGFSLVQYRILLRLVEEGEPMRCNIVAHDLLLKPNMVTTASDSLMKRGMLDRRRGDDRRAVYLSVSKSGIETAARVTDAIVRDRGQRSPRCTVEENEGFLALAREIVGRQAR